MINLRYHIVSITAVFLALGIGVTLGSTMIQRYTIDTLEGRLDELGERLDRTDGENSLLRGALSDRDELLDRVAEDATGLYEGHLDGIPTLVLAVQGGDDDQVAHTRRTLRGAGAEVSGTLVFTARWDDLSDDELGELSDAAGRNFSTETIARTTTLRMVAAELAAASEPAPEPELVLPGDGAPGDEMPGDQIPGGEGSEEGPGDGALATPSALEPTQVDPEGTDPDAPEADPTEEETDLAPAVPSSELIDELIDRGFVEFVPEFSASALPTHDMRFVLVADDSAAVAESRLARPLVESLGELTATPLVVAGAFGPEPPLDLDADDTDEADRVPPLIRFVRADDSLRELVSTVDAVGRFVGDAGLVLAIGVDPDEVGHFGLGPDAEQLLPGTGPDDDS